MPYNKKSDYRRTEDGDDTREPSPIPAARKPKSVAPNQQKPEYDAKKVLAPNTEPTGGPITSNYTEFVQKIFSPANQISRSASALADYSDNAYTNEIPAKLQLKLELMEAAAELRSKGCEFKLFSPMDAMCDVYSRAGLEDTKYAKYDVYKPKSNAEWFSLAHGKPQVTETPSIHYKVAKTATSPNYWNYKAPYEAKTSRTISGGSGSGSGSDDYVSRRYRPQAPPKHYVIDYSNFRSAPLSPYLYSGHEYVRRHDSRIVGSDFVMLTLRPNDDFLHKIDKTLAEAKKINRWS